MFDEVIQDSGPAAGGAQRLYDVRPDLTCLGKIIGGGLPVGAYGGRARLMDLVAPAGPVYQAGTLSGNPLAMTAGLWSLENCRRGCTSISRSSGHSWRMVSRTPRGRRSVALQVNAFGSLLTPFFTDRPVRDYDSALAADTGAYATVLQRQCWREGSIFRPSQFEAWFLSAAHTPRHIDQTIKAARDAMKEV